MVSGGVGQRTADGARLAWGGPRVRWLSVQGGQSVGLLAPDSPWGANLGRTYDVFWGYTLATEFDGPK